MSTGDNSDFLGGFLKAMREPFRKEEPLTRSVRIRADITARAGYFVAEPIARSWAADVTLDIVKSGGDLDARTTKGPCVAYDGSLKKHGAWNYRFASLERGRGLWVCLMASGTVEAKSFPSLASIPTAPCLAPSWIDSDRAMAVAEARAGQAWRAQGNSVFDVLLELAHAAQEGGQSLARWQMRYITTTPDGARRDLFVHVDPYTGESIKTYEE